MNQKHYQSKYHANVNVNLIKKCNSNQWCNIHKCRCECEKLHVCKKDYFWNPVTCSCENGNYLASIMDNSMKKRKLFQQILMKKATHKTQNFYILFAFLLITLALLIAVSIYCYLIKYQAKQKHLLPFHDTNNELRKVLY